MGILSRPASEPPSPSMSRASTPAASDVEDNDQGDNGAVEPNRLVFVTPLGQLSKRAHVEEGGGGTVLTALILFHKQLWSSINWRALIKATTLFSLRLDEGCALSTSGNLVTVP